MVMQINRQLFPCGLTSLNWQLILISHMTPEQAKLSAVEHAGGAPTVAKALGISLQAVWKWRLVPAERVVALEGLAGGRVTRHQMRPDIFGPAPKPAKAAA